MPARSERLAEYNAKRDFGRTGEPKGKMAPARKTGLSFLVQKHAASRLHYDLRLEWEGVLLSWAVTKGPSDAPSEKRLSVRTEDHPLDYGSFEGTIPKGEYGGGTVMLWDRGHWEPLHDPAEGLRTGMLHFRVHGQRMKGGWALIRMKPRPGEKRENWLLVKERDDEASNDPHHLTEAHLASIVSGRTMEQIASDGESAVWSSDSDKEPAHEPQKAGAREVGARKAGATVASAVRARAVKAGATKDAATKTGAGRAGAAKAGVAKADATKADAAKAGAAKAGAAKAGAAKAGTKQAGAAGAGAPPPPPKKARKTKAEDPVVAGIRVSSPGREMFPGAGVTKLDIATYYAEAGKRVLETAARRPFSLVRCPDGIGSECFYQKHPSRGWPADLQEVDVEEGNGSVKPYLYATAPAGLVAAAQMGTIEFHVWGAHVDRLDRPDRFVLDLDPDDDLPFDTTRAAAVEVRDLLRRLGLESMPMLTGGKGIHVVLPLRRTIGWPALKAFARSFAYGLAGARPDRFLARASKAERKGRIFIDWMRNDRGSTAIAPYSVRARPGAPVATPLTWEELAGVEGGNAFTIETVRNRLDRPCPAGALPAQSIGARATGALESLFR